MNRRQFLRTGVAACTAFAITPPVRALDIPEGMDRRDLPKPRADAIVVLWLPGGVAQTDFFDPKKFTPFFNGMRAMDLLGTCPSIPTNVDGIRFGAGLEGMASVMDKGTLIRTISTPARSPLHTNEQFRMMTGYQFPTAFKAPSLGAMISRTLGPREKDVPANIHLARSTSDAFAQTSKSADFVNSIHGSGFYGVEHAPFHVPEPGDGIKTLYTVSGMSKKMLDDRLALLNTITGYTDHPIANSPQTQNYLKTLSTARSMMDSPAREAFDISKEPTHVRNSYRTKHRFGRACLVARRLIELGARYVQVDYPFQAFNLIDTHNRGYELNRITKMIIDPPISQLVRELDERGLLSRTIVVVMTEFGRGLSMQNGMGYASEDTVLDNLKLYGFHGHFEGASCALIYGGGFNRGFAYGETRTENPLLPLDNPIGVSDLHATLFTALGIAPDVYYINESRPVYVTKNGDGRPITDLYA